MFRSRTFPFILFVLIVLSIQPVLTLPAWANPPEADGYAQQIIDQSRAERITPARPGSIDLAIEPTAAGLNATTVTAHSGHTHGNGSWQCERAGFYRGGGF